MENSNAYIRCNWFSRGYERHSASWRCARRCYSGSVRVYVLNAGSTSTKLGLAQVSATSQGGLSLNMQREEVHHPDLQAALPGETPRDVTLRGLEALRANIAERTGDWEPPDAVAARGGLMGPVAAGTYEITTALAQYLLSAPFGIHATNLGAQAGLEWANRFGVPAYMVDPPSVDELLPEARVSGFPGLERQSRFHALNARAVARRAAREVGKRFEEAVIVVAHLGGGLSVTTFDGGRAIDTTGALLDEGPFSPQRAGALPIRGLLDLAYSMPRPELEKRLVHNSGFKGLLGTNDLRLLAAREEGDEGTRLVVAAFIHQVCKAVGAYALASTRPDAIAVTGGVSRWPELVARLEARLRWIAPVICVPGELELEALAEGAARVLFGFEDPRSWTTDITHEPVTDERA